MTVSFSAMLHRQIPISRFLLLAKYISTDVPSKKDSIQACFYSAIADAVYHSPVAILLDATILHK